MDGKRIQCLQTVSQMYPSIFNSVSVIRTASAKNRHFHAPPPTFLFPLETHRRISRNMLHGWKDNSMLAKCRAACTYLFSTVIRCLSQCVSPKIAIFTTFPPGDAPGAITLSVVQIEREFDAYKLSLFLPHFPLGTPPGQSR